MPDLLETENCPLNYYCAKSWDELIETKNPAIKFCKQCNHEVYFCETMEDFNKRALAGQCVAYLVYKDTGLGKVAVDNPIGLPKRPPK
jgi:hypothetical protein